MNAINPPGPGVPVIPASAPFSVAQRAWLNGFLAGLYGGADQVQMSVSAAPPEEDFPWHDPALDLAERSALAEGKPMARQLMARMAQLDCGQCGYLCQTYAEALAEGREASPSLCVPGGRETAKAVKALLADIKVAPAAAPRPSAPVGEAVRLIHATRLTAPGSDKDVRHVAIDLSGRGLRYEPGDSISITAPNDPGLVAATLAALRVAATPELVEALMHRHDIARPLDATLDLLAMSALDASEAAALRLLAEGADEAEPRDADLLDLLEAFPSTRPPLADLLRSLPPLRPRLYSIASSLAATPGRAELCVGVVRDMRRGRVRNGIASTFLADRAEAPFQAQIQASHFRLPTDPKTRVIMVGPGTGVAPFRAFLQHRAAHQVRGNTWLFFGDRRVASDFLFRDELRAWQADGTLQRLDLAWSRDGAAKDYVQHRMLENAAELWRWLQDGAHFYVCGDASRMAKDVDAALRRIAETEGAMTAEAAKSFTAALARQGRYLRDVY
jgi:sulfite reductase (NADPH) flavoprotein alpha-component